jgi:hypothetical protein
LHWNTSKYPDVEYAEVLESMYLPASSRIGNERILDVSKLKYTYSGEIWMLQLQITKEEQIT